MRIDGKVFLVTGGGNGIGREVVLGLLARGAQVAAVDLREDGLAETARLAGASVGDRLSLHPADVTDRERIASVVADAIAAHGAIDGLVNVAGIIQPFVKIVDLSFEDIERVMGVNFWGVVTTTKSVLPELLTRPEACIVNVSSMGGFTPIPGQSAYGASKAAVKLFTEGLYAELRGTAVAVTVVFPGAIRTGISENSGVTVGASGATAADADTSGFPMTEPTEAARQIIEAITKGSYRVTIGKDATMLDRLSRLAPQRATDLIAKKMASLLA
jgi:short-subunit dehydrogenase